MTECDLGEAQEVLERVERERGMARGWTRMLAQRDPDMLERVHELVMHVLHERQTLPLKFKYVLVVCLNASQFHEFGVRTQTRAALQNGASEEEILEALEIVAISNLYGMSKALPMVMEEIQAFRDRTGAQ
ncbi:carboxymuconolactone decarboxylase family protein [Rhizobium sp. BK456]|uniref:carboxymuconolactone decarboxylase family protein n=1 Tax=Rhizobium sp. BK456 TaxID=2587007 RepID=UPI001610DBCE|nr:carboxymuconolactone decarboxylase family protein [Rhizobium sp. BK456]MBB3527009.1 alkylhydroperoxidase/carboxymuconolactone decarboxylase family protein YurZ [Rhizobium sp. BK456]